MGLCRLTWSVYVKCRLTVRCYILGHMLGVNIETDMRQKLFDHIQKLSFRFFDNNKTGHLISRLTNDLMEIGEIAHHGPEDLFIAVMTLVGAFSFMMMINWKLALLTFFVIPFLLWLALYFNKNDRYVQAFILRRCRF